MFRQGDILITKVLNIPKKAKKKKDTVLVYGEVTGHKHLLRDGDVYEMGNDLYLQTYIPTEIIHEEHLPIPIEMPGVYKVKRKREYTNADAVRLVID